MKIAAIISLYKNDDPHYYREALDSIVNQTIGHENIHIYQAIDGEISDELEQVVTDYMRYFYKVVRITPNRGLANALNRLIRELSDEEYVFRMDSDDIARVDRFEKQLSFMKDHPEIGILGMSISEFNETGNAIKRNYPLTHKELVNTIPKASPVAHPTVCFRKTALDTIEGYPTEYHLCEDIALWFNAIEKGVLFANLPDIGLDFRVQANFFERRSMSKAMSEFKVYWNGVKAIFGVSPKLLFPLFRLISRLVPKPIIKLIYSSSLREMFLK